VFHSSCTFSYWIKHLSAYIFYVIFLFIYAHLGVFIQQFLMQYPKVCIKIVDGNIISVVWKTPSWSQK